ncbi:transglycosylase SLT domain-containing protein [Acinetobacter sp. 187]|uniref:Transglycosylase SLT domain-containing protein n=1 Tax=Acinetobacter lanii TaxID=2715163 RepID=A0A6G8S2W3_9GAMM|nr:transglycosylase SLT domain-containing protein [Acinetobacter lanii]NHC02541.1 transglycosylase SLT domain-containing protein [Acinetobacter lanii]QIO08313.1 transglycosylase SLT domain-containing protein [Acinetobacter lanii]
MHSSSSSGSRLCLQSFISSHTLKAMVLATAIMPFHSINASKTNQYNSVVNSNTLTVVAVSNPSVVFKDGNFRHGFGYDLVNNYAKSLNVRLDFKTVPSNEAALKMVQQGKANFAVTTASAHLIEAKKLTTFSASCGDFSSLSKNGLNTEINWVFKHADDPLTDTASGFVCQSKQNGAIKQLASFYNRNVVKPSDWNAIQSDLSKRMPIYKASFKKSAQKYNLDWHFLAAIGYQESYLKPDSVSPTGVRGIMMLTDGTARAMGVSNRVDPAQSIQGGAKYFDQMMTRYAHIPVQDRYWYALVAYNMGPGATDQIMSRLRAQGKNPNDWIQMYDYLNRNQARNGRYKQAVQYVTRIRSYLEHIKTTPKLLNI